MPSLRPLLAYLTLSAFSVVALQSLSSVTRPVTSRALLRSPLFVAPPDDASQDEVSLDASSITSSSTSLASNKTILQSLDDMCQNLKPKASKAAHKASLVRDTSKGKQLLYLMKSSLYYAAFIVYRGYRGFFVILPAVFRQVYAKLETAGLDSPFDEGDVVPEEDSTPAKWRTRITVSIMASFVTLTYVLSGLASVLVKFAKTLVSTSSLSVSWEAAADEQLRSEQLVQEYNAKKMKFDAVDSVNGKDISQDKKNDLKP